MTVANRSTVISSGTRTKSGGGESSSQGPDHRSDAPILIAVEITKTGNYCLNVSSGTLADKAAVPLPARKR
jgi:hypothetical protein